ncbi:MAG: hypothetical protein EXS67_05595 [Candidatus Margulisbacteria bacterium]|nr:hypothetical protein [Candidatus Margulisiibacteriota bacterium]
MSNKKQDEFEYNDGLGDLLREKRRSKFSWTRSGLMLMIVMFAVFAGLTLLFNLVKPLFVSDEPVIKKMPTITTAKSESVPVKPGAAMSEEDVQTKIARIEAENQALIAKLEEAKKSAKKVVAAAPVVEQVIPKKVEPKKSVIKKTVIKKPVIVKVKTVKSEPVVKVVPVSVPEPALASKGSFYVFAGAFATCENAEIQKKQLATLQEEALIIPFEKNGQTLFRVQVGAQKTHADAVSLVGKLQRKGIAAYANSK